MTKIISFYFEILIYFFFKFETISPKTHFLTLNSKSISVKPKVKMYFYHLIKLILVIFFTECYFCENKLKINIIENFSRNELPNFQEHIYTIR